MLLPALILRREFKRLGGYWPSAHFALALVSAAAVSSALALFPTAAFGPGVVGGVLAVLTLVALCQWHFLHPDVRRRVRSLI